MFTWKLKWLLHPLTTWRLGQPFMRENELSGVTPSPILIPITRSEGTFTTTCVQTIEVVLITLDRLSKILTKTFIFVINDCNNWVIYKKLSTDFGAWGVCSSFFPLKQCSVVKGGCNWACFWKYLLIYFPTFKISSKFFWDGRWVIDDFKDLVELSNESFIYCIVSTQHKLHSQHNFPSPNICHTK